MNTCRILLFLLVGISYIKLNNGDGCTLNNYYSRIVRNRKIPVIIYDSLNKKLTLYDTNLTQMPLIKPGETYHNCSLGYSEIVRPFRFGLMTRLWSMKETYKTMRCDMNGDGHFVPNDCRFKDRHMFAMPEAAVKLQNQFEFFFLQCGTTAEFIYEVGVKGFEHFQISIATAKKLSERLIQVAPGDDILCHGLCVEYGAYIRMTSNLEDFVMCSDNICTVKRRRYQSTLSNNSIIVRVSCGDISINVQPIYNFKIKLEIVGQKQRKEKKYDAGDIITCKSYFKKSFDSNVAPLRNIEILLAVFVKTDKDRNIYFNQNHRVYEIPHGARTEYWYYCYSGNRTDLNSMYIMHTGYLPIIATYKTYLVNVKTKHGIPYADPLSILSSTRVSCDRKKYPSPFKVYPFYARSLYYPRSYIRKYIGAKFPFRSKATTIFRTHKNPKMNLYVTCVHKDYHWLISTPIKVETSTKPFIKWVYINPPYETKYHLRYFVIGCLSKNVYDKRVLCQDPLADSILKIDEKSKDLISVFILPSAPMDKDLKIECNATVRSRLHLTINKILRIRVRHYSGLNTKNDFIISGDKVHCVAQFHKYRGSSILITVPLVTSLRVHNDLRTSYDGKPIDTSYPLTTIFSFSYCCMKYRYDLERDFDFNQFYCSNWKYYKMARNFYVQYTPDIKSVFCNDVVSCHICINYTHLYDRMCYGANRIKSTLRLITQNPLGAITDTGEVEKVRIPCPEDKIDRVNNRKEKYSIDEYVFQIGCKINNEIEMKGLFVRSCLNNPPPVFILPEYKEMFEIGDLLSCATKSIRCTSTLKYVIYVQRGAEEMFYEDSRTFELTLKQLGNNVVIKCAPGETHLATDTRIIRVEVAPYNITIIPRLRYLFYPDYIKCKAMGFPKPTYQWTQHKGKSRLRISENSVLIGPWDLTGHYIFTCEARNSRGLQFSNISFIIFNKRIDMTDYSELYYSWMCVSLVIYKILLFLNVVFCYQESFFNTPFWSNKVVRVRGYERKKTPKKVSAAASPTKMLIKKN